MSDGFQLRLPRSRRPPPAQRTRRVDDRLIRLGSLLLTLALGAAWLAFAKPVWPSATVSSPARPVLGFITGPPAGSHDVRLVRSPALFSLPGPVGFSSPLQGQEIIRAGLVPDEELPVMIAPAPPVVPANPGESGRNLAELMNQSRPRLIPPLPETRQVLAVRPVASSPAYRILWEDQPGEPVTGIDLPTAAATTNGTPWEAEFYVIFDRGGLVDRIMIEKPAPAPEINQALAFFIRGVQAPAAVAGGGRRLIVKYQPSVAPAE
jgi:hypothetical protein